MIGVPKENLAPPFISLREALAREVKRHSSVLQSKNASVLPVCKPILLFNPTEVSVKKDSQNLFVIEIFLNFANTETL